MKLVLEPLLSLEFTCDQCGVRFAPELGGVCSRCGRTLCRLHLHGLLGGVRRLALVLRRREPTCRDCRSVLSALSRLASKLSARPPRPSPPSSAALCFWLSACLLMACTGGGDDSTWPPEAVRAVIQRIDQSETGRRVVIDPNVRGEKATTLPWGVRQSLITAGYSVAEHAASDTTVVISFAQPVATTTGWRITTALAREGGAAPAAEIRWNVTCADRRCTVSDSASF